MHVLIGGASGLIGKALEPHLKAHGHRVTRLVRNRPAPNANEIEWHPAQQKLDPAALEDVDVIIHLSGENVASGRWTEARKKAILNSRVDSTRLIADTLTAMTNPPKIWLCASATGYYGSRGDEILTESSAPGDNFLASVCKAWEAAAAPARDKGVRVVNTRFGAVFSPEGGAYKMMATPFKLGLGGKVGSGDQWMSWITLQDVIRALTLILSDDAIHGPVNIVSPNPVTNSELTKTLGKVFRRPTMLPVPAVAARLALGEMAEEMLLSSARVHPEKLLSAGFTFEHPVLEEAVRALNAQA